MDNDLKRVAASAMAGLTFAETEAVLGRKLTPEDKVEYSKAKAAMKLKAKQQETGMQVPEGMPLAESRMPSIAERYTKKQVEEAVERCHGRWPLIAKCLNCSYPQLRVWFANHRDHDLLAKSLREELVDQAEEAMWQLVNSDDIDVRKQIAMFILKTLGKSRGWSEAPSSQIVQQISMEDKMLQVKNIFGIADKEESNAETGTISTAPES